ncbi:MAG: recombinase RecT [Pseudonocardia sp.]|nr:recombinase RecT [Pseudonocardia sp.]
MSPTTRTVDTTAARNQLAVAQQGGNTIAQMFDRQKNEIARALPAHMDADRLARIATTVVKQTPRLLECTDVSLLGALMLSAQTGLEPGPLGLSYFTPRRIKGVWEVVWIMGYKGIVRLARNSGEIKSIVARPVYQRDTFEYAYGLEDHLLHKPSSGDRGQVIASYAVALYKDGGHTFEVLEREEIEARRGRGAGGGRDDVGPWVTDFPAMAAKSAIRKMAPWLPLSVEAVGAIQRDEQVTRGIVTRDDIEAGAPYTPPPADDVADDVADAELVEPDFDPESGEQIPAGVGR